MAETLVKKIQLFRKAASGQSEIKFHPETESDVVLIPSGYGTNTNLSDFMADDNYHIKAAERTALNAINTAGGFVQLDANGLVPVANIPDHAWGYVVADITERDALDAANEPFYVLVLDASADSTVSSGAATYVWKPAKGGNTGAFHKISEQESMDVIVDWSNIQNKPNSTVAQIDQAVTDDHTHANKAVLDKLTYDANNGGLLYDGAEVVDSTAAHKLAAGVQNNFMMFDANGDIADSGKNDDSFVEYTDDAREVAFVASNGTLPTGFPVGGFYAQEIA